MGNFFKNAWAEIIKGSAMAGGFLMGLFGEWDILLTMLLCFLAVDYILGMIVAAMGKSPKSETGGLNSNAGFAGLLRKVVVMIMVMVAAMVDKVIGTNGTAFRSMACLFYISNEGLSILENSALAGVPWPDKLKNALEQMSEKKTDQG